MKYLTNLEKYRDNLFFQGKNAFKNASLIGLITFFYLPIYGQVDFCAIRLDSATLIKPKQKRVEITAISTAESVDTIKKRLSTEGYKDKIQSERYDSCIIWVYFRTNDGLHKANALEQCYLEHRTTACRRATLYSFQNNQLQDSVQYPDSQLTLFNLVPLTSINNEPKEWVLKMVMTPYSTDTLRSTVALYITSKQVFEADNYRLLKYKIPLIAIICILIFMAVFSLFQYRHSVHVAGMSHIAYALYMLAFLPFLYIKLFGAMGGYYFPYINLNFNIGEPVSAYLVVIFYFWFIMTLLDMKRLQPWWYQRFFVINSIGVLFLVVHCFVFALHLFASYYIYVAFRVYQLFTTFFLIYFLWTQKPKYLFWGSLSLHILSAITILSYKGDIPLNTHIADVILYLGILIEIICMSLSLSYRIRVLKDEKTASENNLKVLNSRLHADIMNGLNNLLWELNDDDPSETIAKKPIAEAVELLYIKSRDICNADMLNDKTLVDLLQSEDKIKLLAKKGIKTTFDIDEALTYDIVLPQHINQGISLIYNEVINNVFKYSNCQNLVVKLYQSEDAIHLTIKDDGIGFNPKEVSKNGLKLMQEDAKRFGGQLNIASALGKGTEISLLIPSMKPKKAQILRGPILGHLFNLAFPKLGLK